MIDIGFWSPWQPKTDVDHERLPIDGNDSVIMRLWPLRPTCRGPGMHDHDGIARGKRFPLSILTLWLH